MNTSKEFENIKFLIGEDVSDNCEMAHMSSVEGENGERVFTTPPAWFRQQYANIFSE